MVSFGTNETIRFTKIIPSHIKIHHLSIFIPRENEILFPPHQIMQFFLWLHFMFNQAVLCHSSIQSNTNQMSEWHILLAQWIVMTMLIVFDYGNPYVFGGVIVLSVLLHGYAWMNRGHCTSKDFTRRKRGLTLYYE